MKTRCKRGHPLEGENLYVNPAGVRACRTCRRACWRAHERTEKGRARKRTYQHSEKGRAHQRAWDFTVTGRASSRASNRAYRRTDKYRANRQKHGSGNHRSRARYYGVPYEPINASKVFERDGWYCQQCGVPTPKELRGTKHERAPELGHIVPMSQGGGHLYTNVRCECRSCNSTKNDLLDSELFKGEVTIYANGERQATFIFRMA